MFIRFSAISVFAVFALSLSNAYALPLGSAAEQARLRWPESAFAANRGLTVDFTAIVALSNCSGSLVRFRSSLPTDPAMILTNGHCLENGFVPPGGAVVNAPSNRTFRLLSGDAKTVLGSLRATRILYATMTKTDMALYGVRETYDDIEKRFGVSALTLADYHPGAGRNIAIPSGYWRRIYSCSIDRFVYELREDDYSWSDSILYRQPGCATIGGTSGSPVIDTDTYEVIGVNNTGNDNGERCTMNNPCEVDQNGNVTVTRKASYGQQIYWIYSCLDTRNQLQLGKQGCQLPKPTQGWRGRPYRPNR